MQENCKSEGIAYQSAVDGLGCCAIEGEDAPEGLAAGLRPPLHLGARVQRSRSGLGAHHGFLLGLVSLLVAENVVLGDGVFRVPVHNLLGVRQRTLPTLRLATHSPRQRGRQPGSAAHRRIRNAAFLELSLKWQRRKASRLGAGDSVRHHQGCHDRCFPNLLRSRNLLLDRNWDWRTRLHCMWQLIENWRSGVEC